MNLYVYSDESGWVNNTRPYFVYGGLILLSAEEKSNAETIYKSCEDILKKTVLIGRKREIKASGISDYCKDLLFNSMRRFFKFGVIIDNRKLNPRILNYKKHRQRFIEYAFRAGVKNAVETLVKKKRIKKTQIENMHFFADNHPSAINTVYEMNEELEKEYKRGCFSAGYTEYKPPFFRNIKSVNMTFCDSQRNLLIRASDIIANTLYNQTLLGEDCSDPHFIITEFPTAEDMRGG